MTLKTSFWLKKQTFSTVLVILLPLVLVGWVWLSSLAFIPVPWPDDSAFYFVAKELFKWPPRWVMLPQAPFEPTYRIFNFNTMPLYPILIGLGRWVGIDGSFLLKIWPLGAWAISGSLLGFVLLKKGLPLSLCCLWLLGLSLDPEMRWASVLVRPESLVGLFGTALILGLTFGFPKKLQPTRYWDPVAALLALAAYAHFNSVHLVFPVIFTFYHQPKRLIQIGLKTILYLAPWLICVIYYFDIFCQQMSTQWIRLAIPNGWLSSFSSATSSLFQSLGSPEPWPGILFWASILMWILFLGAVLLTFILPALYSALQLSEHVGEPLGKSLKKIAPKAGKFSLTPALVWIFSAGWIFHTKPETWFMYFIHISFWCFAAIAALYLWTRSSKFHTALLVLHGTLTVLIVAVFGQTDLIQATRLNQTQSWHWETYYEFVDCVEDRLIQYQSRRPIQGPYKVWCPTFPDITIELSRRHPDWEFTRTDDFPQRYHLAVQHGWEADVVVVTETLNWAERSLSSDYQLVPEISSAWMNFKGYYLNTLWNAPGWKPNRYVCQRGRWQAFLFMDPETQLNKNSLSKF